MITLTFPWLVGLVALVFVAILILVACYKSPMRKWLCFAISTITIAYLLYIMLWQQYESGQRLEWYLLGCVGIIAALVLSGVGFMDLVKPVAIEKVMHEEPVVSCPPVEKECQEEVMDTSDDEESVDDIDSERTDEGDGEDEAKRIQREELIGKVMPWFLDQLNQYSDEEKNAIKVCAIDFVNEGKLSKPEVEIMNNSLYSHNRIIEICSAFYLIGIPKEACVTFVKLVFANSFAKTEDGTILKKIKGPDKMLEIVDTYWETQGLNVKSPLQTVSMIFENEFVKTITK